MAHIERTIEILRPRSTVWRAVADLGAVVEWNPNISEASCGLAPWGVGATRTCHMVNGGHIDEVVSNWVEGRSIQFAIGSHGGIRSADMGMTLSDTEHGTRVTASVDYHLAFGPLGPVIDRLAVKRQMVQMLDEGLSGLKGHLEINQQEPTTRRETT